MKRKYEKPELEVTEILESNFVRTSGELMKMSTYDFCVKDSNDLRWGND